MVKIPGTGPVRGIIVFGSIAAVLATTVLLVTFLRGPSSETPAAGTSASDSPTGADSTNGTTPRFPTEDSTGVPDGIALRPSGDLTITTPGAVIDGYDISGVVQVKADDVVIRNSRIHGSSWWSVEVAEGLTGVVVENCDIDGRGESGTSNSMGVMGPATVRGNDISGVENGVTPGTGSVIEGNYIHDLGAPGDPHYDGIQIDGNVSDILIRGNTIIVNHNQTSAVMIANDFGPATDISVEDNYLAGGSYTVYSDGQFDGGPISGVRFIDNVLEPGLYGYASIERNSPEISGNVDADTGETVPLTSGR
jgi:hypothetical protein